MIGRKVDVSGGAKAELVELLMDFFTVHDLEQFCAEHVPALSAEISFQNSLRQVAFDAVSVASRHGVIDAEFFEALTSERPRRRAEIERCRDLFVVEAGLRQGDSPEGAHAPRADARSGARRADAESRRTHAYDVFLSHASEDKPHFVAPLYEALVRRELRVWYDAKEIQWGDDFRHRMEEGLSQSRFGLVVLSPHFPKYWPQQELSVLHTLEAGLGQSRILPILLNMTTEMLRERFPFMAGRRCAMASEGIEVLADMVVDRLGSDRAASDEPVPSSDDGPPDGRGAATPPALDVHRHGFAQWLQTPGFRPAFVKWLNSKAPNVSASASAEVIIAAWAADENLAFWLDTAIRFADRVLTDAAKISRKEARAAVRQALAYLVPLHRQAPTGDCAMTIEIDAAKRIGGPVQLSVGIGTLSPRAALPIDEASEILDALQSVSLPDGLPPLEDHEILTAFYSAVATSKNITPSAARDQLRRGYEQYKNDFEMAKLFDHPVHDMERPIYLRIPKGHVTEDVLAYLRRDIENGVFEENTKGSSAALAGAIETTFLRLAQEIDP